MKQFYLITLSEVYRMFARQRTYIGYAAFTGFNLIFLILLSQPGPSKAFRRPLEGAGYLFEDYFSALTLAYANVVFSAFLLMVPFFALVAGDMVAKESEDGNLRLILSRPVSRLNLLLSKFLACHFYSFTLVVFVGFSAYLVGVGLAKWDGGLFAAIPRVMFSVFDFETGIVRYAIAVLLLGLSMSVVSSVGFLLSCQRMKPAAATILTICIFFIDRILADVPYFEEYRDWFLYPSMWEWLGAFRERILWAELVENYAFLFGVSITCFIIGWLTFERRDLKA